MKRKVIIGDPIRCLEAIIIIDKKGMRVEDKNSEYERDDYFIKSFR